LKKKKTKNRHSASPPLASSGYQTPALLLQLIITTLPSSFLALNAFYTIEKNK